MASSRQAFALLVALVLAAVPILGALTSAYAASPHAAMMMGDAAADDGCCDHQDPDAANACLAHCGAGFIDASCAVVPREAVSVSAVPALVRLSASHAPPPDTAPPKSSVA